MTHRELVAFTLDNGDKVMFEVTVSPSGDEYVAREPDVKDAMMSLDTALKKAKGTIQSVINTLKEINTPKNIELEFAVRLDAEAGIIFASVGTEASFMVKVTWDN